MKTRVHIECSKTGSSKNTDEKVNTYDSDSDSSNSADKLRKSIDYELPADATAFNTGTFINPDNKDDTYQSIEYGGRTYIPYGILKKGIDSDDTGRCLEYEYWKKKSLKRCFRDFFKPQSCLDEDFIIGRVFR